MNLEGSRCTSRELSDLLQNSTSQQLLPRENGQNDDWTYPAHLRGGRQLPPRETFNQLSSAGECSLTSLGMTTCTVEGSHLIPSIDNPIVARSHNESSGSSDSRKGNEIEPSRERYLSPESAMKLPVTMFSERMLRDTNFVRSGSFFYFPSKLCRVLLGASASGGGFSHAFLGG